MEKERIVLKAILDEQVGDYLVLNTASKDNQVLTTPNFTLWLPNIEVKVGDLVVIYTKAGIRSSKVSDSGFTSYFIYWGLNKPIWEDRDTALVLLHVDSVAAEPASLLGK